jgi:hypothetical protein
MHPKYLPTGHMPMTYLRMRSSPKIAQDWNEVVARMADPKATRFKALSWDEQASVLEQTVQETIKTREEMTSVEVVGLPKGVTGAVEIAQVAPILDTDLFKVQNVQGMGGLMYQQAQWLMKQMQDNPELIVVPKCPTESPEEIPAGVSDLIP